MFDAYKLKPLFNNLKLRQDIKSNSILYSEILNIERFADGEQEKAFLLGRFLEKYSDTISFDTKELVTKEIKKGRLETYYSKKFKGDKSDTQGFMLFVYILTIGGLFAIGAGVFQLIKGDFWYGLGTKYVVPIVREGGYKVILGLIMVIGGLIRINHQQKKKRFIKSLLTENST